MTCPKTKAGGIAMKSSHWDWEGHGKSCSFDRFLLVQLHYY